MCFARRASRRRTPTPLRFSADGGEALPILSRKAPAGRVSGSAERSHIRFFRFTREARRRSRLPDRLWAPCDRGLLADRSLIGREGAALRGRDRAGPGPGRRPALRPSGSSGGADKRQPSRMPASSRGRLRKRPGSSVLSFRASPILPQQEFVRDPLFGL
jgi:hypothetical protein